MSSSFDAFAAGGEDFDNSTYSTIPPPYTVGAFPDIADHVSHSVNASNPLGFGTDPNYSDSTPFASSIPLSNGTSYGIDEEIFSSDGPGEMQDEGFALREWRRKNAIRIGEKEEKEKEMRTQIIEEAVDFKNAFFEKRKVNIENNRTTNREKEKLYVANQEKFHREADKEYWKTVGEIIPREVPNIDNKRGKKDQDKKKPSIVVVQGPKPGKPTDLARMRHLLLKLKHTPPPHMIPPQPAPGKEEQKDGQGAPANATGVAPPAAVGGQSAIFV